VLRFLVGHDITIGLSVAAGLFLIAMGAQIAVGAAASAIAAIGVVVAIPPDQPAPRRGTLWQLLPAVVLGPPLFYATHLVHANPWALFALLVGATFVAFLGAAWGKRGIPVSMAVMFAMIFALAESSAGQAVSPATATLFFTGGAFAYVIYATLANALLNGRYRAIMVADALNAVAALMRSQARQFVPEANPSSAPRQPLVGVLLRQQAALGDQLQAARNIVLETPDTPRRQQLAAMLVQLLELRDHLMASELDLDTLKAHPDQLALLSSLAAELDALAARIEALADALLFGRVPAPFAPLARDIPRLGPAGDASGEPAPAAILARGLIARIGHIHEEVGRLAALARGDVQPDLALVRENWQLFTSPVEWSLRPFLALWRWDAPPLRHAIRAALAIGAGEAISLALPWGTHEYWILLTITVVLRGSFAQTIERRNHRVLGTLLGCAISAALLFAHLARAALQTVAVLAQGIAHAFAPKKYFVTAVAGTLLGLLQSYLLRAGSNAAFDVVERIADTLIGAGVAWGASYLLPSWERTQIPSLVQRALAAQANHARMALGLAPPASGKAATPEIEWRLARREVYDSLSALVQATQRSLAEPRAVRPPLEPLGRMLAHGYQMLAQLTAIKGMLLLRRERLHLAELASPLAATARAIESTLSAERPAAPVTSHGKHVDDYDATGPVQLLDPLQGDLTPWVLRRLELASGIARHMRDEADRVHAAS
jgi:uncharacterized membrane protein YccC